MLWARLVLTNGDAACRRTDPRLRAALSSVPTVGRTQFAALISSGGTRHDTPAKSAFKTEQLPAEFHSSGRRFKPYRGRYAERPLSP